MRKIAIILVVILLFVVFLLAFKQQLLLIAGDFLIIKDDLHPADVIHVIAGEDYRTEYAIELYKQGLAKYIFFTGGCCETHGWNHGEHGQQLAIRQGIPLEAISYDDSFVTSTYSETVRLNEWIDQSPIPIRSVIVVSDPYHMRRARWTYRQVLGKDIEIQMSPVPFEQTPYQRRWWEDWQSKRYVKDEYLKFAYYIARYQLSRGWIKVWLTRYDTE
jgi:uncharacterized SAM-binding protein YcdF (DUF218 family)